MKVKRECVAAVNRLRDRDSEGSRIRDVRAPGLKMVYRVYRSKHVYGRGSLQGVAPMESSFNPAG
jgi:hypothetical protein